VFCLAALRHPRHAALGADVRSPLINAARRPPRRGPDPGLEEPFSAAYGAISRATRSAHSRSQYPTPPIEADCTTYGTQEAILAIDSSPTPGGRRSADKIDRMVSASCDPGHRHGLVGEGAGHTGTPDPVNPEPCDRRPPHHLPGPSHIDRSRRPTDPNRDAYAFTYTVQRHEIGPDRPDHQAGRYPSGVTPVIRLQRAQRTDIPKLTV